MSHGFDFATQNLSESVRFIPAPSYLTEGGLVKIRKLLDEVSVPVDLDLSQATGLTYIAPGAFIGCPTLQSVKLPSSVTEIGQYAFHNCYNLTSVTIPANVKTIGKSAFAFTDLTKVAIPEGVTTIGDYAFEGCSRLAEVIFQETGGWHLQDPMTNEIDADTIVVDDSSTNATNLKDYAGQWYGKYLIRK